MPVLLTVFYGEVHSVRTLGRISGLQESFPNDRYPGLTEQQDVAIGVIHQALDAGISLLDTADIYAPSWNSVGHNEIIVGKAFASWQASPEQKAKVVIAIKAGGRPEEGGMIYFGFIYRSRY